MQASRLLSFALVPLFALAACNSDGDRSPDAQTNAEAPATTAPAPSADSGRVLETMNSGGYTYVRLDMGGGEVWAAGPQLDVAVGDQVTLGQSMEMRNYHSKTLDRTFESVLFATSISVAGKTPAAANPHGGAVKPTATVEVGNVAPIEGGQTVATVIQDSAAYSGKEVAIRGKVVKFNGGIMGTNWLHIQDGSGSAADGTHDLTVTTDGSAAVGDVVVVRGVVTTDKDFGAGYKYAVIIEGAAISAE